MEEFLADNQSPEETYDRLVLLHDPAAPPERTTRDPPARVNKSKQISKFRVLFDLYLAYPQSFSPEQAQFIKEERSGRARKPICPEGKEEINQWLEDNETRPYPDRVKRNYFIKKYQIDEISLKHFLANQRKRRFRRNNPKPTTP